MMKDRQKQIEDVLHSNPNREARVDVRVRPFDGAWIPGDEALDRGNRARTLRHGHCDDQNNEADRKQPQEIEPSAPAETHARNDAFVRRGETAVRPEVQRMSLSRSSPSVTNVFSDGTRALLALFHVFAMLKPPQEEFMPNTQAHALRGQLKVGVQSTSAPYLLEADSLHYRIA